MIGLEFKSVIYYTEYMVTDYSSYSLYVGPKQWILPHLNTLEANPPENKMAQLSK
jgi:hypothetical protein